MNSSEGHELYVRPFGRDLAEQKALVAGFVKAAPGQAAGVGIGGLSRPLHAAEAVHMPQRQIGEVGFFDLRRRNGAVLALAAGHFAVQNAQSDGRVATGKGRAVKGLPLLGGGEGGAGDGGVQLR